MKISLFITVLIFYTLNGFSQEILFEEDIDLKTKVEVSFRKIIPDIGSSNLETYPVVNSIDNELALFIMDKNQISGLLFNDNFEIIQRHTAPNPESKFKTLLGGNYNGRKFNLIFANSGKNQFQSVTMDLTSNQNINKLNGFKLKKENYLESFSANDKFYLLTVKVLSSIIKLYIFDDNLEYQVKEFDLSRYRITSKDFQAHLPGVRTIKIANYVPVPLDLSSKPIKYYHTNNKLYISFDHSILSTKLIVLDLNNMSSSVKYYAQGIIDCTEDNFIKSNSYIHHNVIFQVKGCKNELYFSVYNLDTDTLIRDYRVTKDEEIEFKNSPLIQEGGTTIFAPDQRELNTTKQILRKIASSNIGISVYKMPEYTEVTLGAFTEVQSNNFSPGLGGSFTSITTPYGPTQIYNPTMYGYSSYSSTKSVYFKSLFSNDLYDHLKRQLNKNAFDKIMDFSEDLDTSIKSKTIFKYEDFYILGYFDKSENKYYLRKFTD